MILSGDPAPRAPSPEPRVLILAAALGLLLLGAGTRFVGAGILPAMETLRGDFSATFPSDYFARLRPDWPPSVAWGARTARWYYGPMMHFLTLPLFLVPSFANVPIVWTAINITSLILSFLLVLKISGSEATNRRMIALLAALWMGFQPLVNCLAQGNIEIVELTLVLAGLAMLQGQHGRWAGVLLGVATMVKYLPAGFIVWLGLRGFRRALVASMATIGVVALCAAVTLGWSNTGLTTMVPARVVAPAADYHTLSITSMFLHQSALPGRTPDKLVWQSRDRQLWAQRAGLLTSGVTALAYAFLFWRRRAMPVGPSERALLFLLMLLLPPWNHDYYYLFAIVPVSLLLLTAQGRPFPGAVGVLTAGAYVMISPPVPYGLMDRSGWFAMPFAHLWNLADLPTLGALLLLALSTHQWLTAPVGIAMSPSSVRG